MSDSDIIVNINNYDDILKIKDNTKYINLNIESIDTKVIDYFILNGKDYMFSDLFNEKSNFLYVNYDIFKMAENKINDIIYLIPNELNDIEKIKYIYISLGKILSEDINLDESKNEDMSYNDYIEDHNIWSVIVNNKTESLTTSKIFMYICARFKYKSCICNDGCINYNKVFLKDNSLEVNLFSDLANIQSKFKTEFFDKFNDDIKLDHKIGYIDNEYSDTIIEKMFEDKNIKLKDINYLTSYVIKLKNIGTYEMFKVLNKINNKYIKNLKLEFNNLYYVLGKRKIHFVLVTYNNKDYYYNYSKDSFEYINRISLEEKKEANKLGFYLNKEVDLL